MKPPAPVASAPSSRRWCRNTASFTSRRRSSAWLDGTRPIRMRRSGPIFPARIELARRSGAQWRPEMAIHVVKVPDIGEGIAEVELVEWRVRPGETVVADQALADVMTDKATVEVPSPVAGTVVAATGNAGDKLAVGSELLR